MCIRDSTWLITARSRCCRARRSRSLLRGFLARPVGPSKRCAFARGRVADLAQERAHLALRGLVVLGCEEGLCLVPEGFRRLLALVARDAILPVGTHSAE